MRTLLLICFIVFPCLLMAQTIAQQSAREDSIIKHERSDTVSTEDAQSKPDSWVADFTNTLSAEQDIRLESKLDSFNNEGTGQLTVVIIKSLREYENMIYGSGVGDYWSVGHEGKDDGILVLVALSDRKMAILTGTGIKKVLTGRICHNIIQTDFIPRFKRRNYYLGLDTGTSDIMNYITASKADQ